MNATVRIGFLGLTILVLATGLAMAIALPSMFAASQGGNLVVISALAMIPLAAGVFYGFALVRTHSLVAALAHDPGLLIVVGAVLILTGLLGLAPTAESHAFPYRSDPGSVVFSCGAVTTVIAGIWAIVEAALCWRSQAHKNPPSTPYPTT